MSPGSALTMVEVVALRKRKPCPICRKPSLQKFHPFCSARCADIDLSRWLGGTYAIPAQEQDEQQDGDGGSSDS